MKTHQTWQVTQARGLHPTYVDCARLAIEHLSARIPAVFAHCGEVLFEAAAEAHSNAEQTALFDGMRELDLRKARLTQAFLERVDNNLSVFFSRRNEAAEGTSVASGVEPTELRVVEDHDLAVTLAIDAMVDGAEKRCKPHLHAFGVRLGLLFHTQPVAVLDNPFAPRIVCEAFRAALSTLESGLDIHLSLYHAFDGELVRHLDAMYSRCNEALVEAGLAPELKYDAIRNDEAGSEETQYAQDDDIGAVVEDADIDTDQPLEQQVFDLVHAWVAQRQTQAAATARVVSTAAVLGQLSQHQAQLVETPTALSAQQIKQQLLDGLAGQQLSADDEATVDMVGMMFDFVAVDDFMPDRFQQALTRLQVPYLRAALHNPDLLAGGTNPARELISELAAVGVGWNAESDRGGRILQHVEGAVEQVVQSHQQDALVQFQNVLNTFRRFRHKCEQQAELRAKREYEAIKGKERLQFARQNVAQLIVRRTRSLPIPPLVRDLVQRAWAHVMVLTVLRHGMQSTQWKQILATLDELIWSVSFKGNDPASVQKLRARLAPMARALSQGLHMVGFQASEIRQLLTHLKHIYQAQIRADEAAASVDTSELASLIHGEDLVSQAALEQAPEEEPVDQLDSRTLAAIRSWKVGQWFLFGQQDDEPLRAKLSWISPITGRYLFVDQRGIKAAEKSPQTLAEDFLQQRISPLEDTDIISRALSAIAKGSGQRAAA